MSHQRYPASLIFPRWDVVVIILAVFLMTYTYIEAKSNYHRGSILILRYTPTTFLEGSDQLTFDALSVTWFSSRDFTSPLECQIKQR